MTQILFACTPNARAKNTDGASPAKGQNLSAEALEYKFTPGTRGQTWVLIHGLGDDMSKLDGLAQLAQKSGYAVLQMDLHGHGLTLGKYTADHSELPPTIDYRDNVTGVKNLITRLNISDELILVGHSYGGAIAYALAAEMEKDQRVHSVHLLAPYVQRLDKLLTAGLNPFGNPNLDDMTDALLDPILEKYMQNTFRSYLLKSYYGGVAYKLTDEQNKELDSKVQAAILVTKGIRKFDLVDKTKPFIKIAAPLQIVGARNDQLVKPLLLQTFDGRLKQEKVAHVLEFTEDAEADHLFPQTKPEDTFNRIQKFITRR